MFRQILGYAPANLLPALVAFGLIYAFTRILSPTEYGTYSLVTSAAMAMQATLIYPLASSMARFYPETARQNAVPDLIRTGFCIFLPIIGLVTVGTAIASWSNPVLWYVVVLVLLRGVINLVQDVNRMANKMGQYNALVICEASIGFMVALFLAHTAPTAANVFCGLAIGSLCCAAIYGPSLLSSLGTGRFSVALFRQIMWYAVPAGLGFLLSSLNNWADRFIIAGFRGVQQLAIYAVAWSLVMQPVNVIASAVAMATLPLSVLALENQGVEAGRLQAGKVGLLIFIVVTPACAGLAICHAQVAGLLAGQGFNVLVSALIPWVAGIVLIRTASTFYLEHAFYLSRRSDLLMWCYLPASIATVVIDLFAVPIFGLYGALIGASISQSILTTMLYTLGARVFALPLPAGHLLRIGLATASMSIVLLAVPSDVSWLHFLERIVLGIVSYSVVLMLLNFSTCWNFLSVARGRA